MVVLDGEEARRVLERFELRHREPLGQAEVEEGDPAVPVEQVVAGMWVAVEGAEAVQAAKGEPVDGLGREVTLALIPAQQLVESRTRDKLAGQHPRAAELANDSRHVDNRVRFVIGCEQVLVVGLEPVVDLLAQPVAQLLDERARVETGKRRSDDPRSEGDVLEVRLDGAGDARVLHLDRHRAPIARDRPMDLADRGRRERQRVPPGEDPLRGLPSSSATTEAASSGLIGGASCCSRAIVLRNVSGMPASR